MRQALLLLDIDSVLPGELERLETMCGQWDALIVCSRDPRAAIQCYQMRPTAFLIAPFSAAALDAAMGRCVSLWQKELESLELTENRNRLKVHLCDIYWVTAMGRGSMIHCIRRDIKVGESMSELIERLPQENFLRCQKSFLVNLYHVRDTDGRFLYMTDGRAVSVGRGVQNDVRKALQAFQQRWNAEEGICEIGSCN